jgi:heme/copper-type cytochrome/quinol oxidase subunit 2
MTVAELIDLLSTLPSDANVTIRVNGGEYIWEMEYEDVTVVNEDYVIIGDPGV